MLRLLMAVSRDGFLARRADDDMHWTGYDDKSVFRLLTLLDVDDRPLYAGATTFDLMPPLPGRQLLRLSRRGLTLERAASSHDGPAWLIGGATVAVAAAEAGLLSDAVLVSSPADLGRGLPAEPLMRHLSARPRAQVRVGGATVCFYRVR